jgi:mannose-6-phosphate isomerase
MMEPIPPLEFAPIFQPYPWGGRRLENWFAGAPASGPLAEAWIVSAEDKHPSHVTGGPFDGRTLTDLIRRFGARLIGHARCPGERFPLLLKFLDARELLSVQVHPTDELAQKLRPGTAGKTEAWVILHAEPGSKLYVGLKSGIDRAAFEQAIRAERVPEVLHSFEPRAGDVVFVPAGTVHAIGAGLMLFEIQQTSDNTFRLHDWGRGRPLHVAESLQCIDFDRGPTGAVSPLVETMIPRRERLLSCPYFRLWRIQSERPFAVGAAGECRVAVAIGGSGELVANSNSHPVRPGSALLIPAELGQIECRPDGGLVILECGLPK